VGWVVGKDGAVPPLTSSPELLTLHAVRLAGYADEGRVSARFGLDRDEVEELLLDFEACGWVARSQFAASSGWSLTEAGRAENESRLSAELAWCGGGVEVTRVHGAFLPLNARFQQAVTRWQLRPLPGQPMARNDHSDFGCDDQVHDTLQSVGRQLEPLCADLSCLLTRFDGYAGRYAAALARADRGEHRWVDGVGVDSCHVVWMQLHEDLLATLGLERGREG
jgi:hypothetical protein